MRCPASIVSGKEQIQGCTNEVTLTACPARGSSDGTKTATATQTLMGKHIPAESRGTGIATKTALPSSILDSLFPITAKELKVTHYRIAAESRQDRERAGREFRMSQPGIYAYLPYAPPILRVLAYENALLCSFARHHCAALEARVGRVPVLRVEDLQAAEARAKTLLAHRPTSKQVEKLGAVQFAVGGILGVHYFDGIKVVPDRKWVLTKVLTLLICFSAALNDLPEHAPEPENRTS